MEKSAILLAYLLIKLINKQGGIFWLLHEKVERKSEKSKQACSSIKDFREIWSNSKAIQDSENLKMTVFQTLISQKLKYSLDVYKKYLP